MDEQLETEVSKIMADSEVKIQADEATRYADLIVMARMRNNRAIASRLLARASEDPVVSSVMCVVMIQKAAALASALIEEPFLALACQLTRHDDCEEPGHRQADAYIRELLAVTERQRHFDVVAKIESDLESMDEATMMRFLAHFPAVAAGLLNEVLDVMEEKALRWLAGEGDDGDH